MIKHKVFAKGDLIQSKGDGTGKVQADDIIRASTVAKVLSTTKIETYSDGSYMMLNSMTSIHSIKLKLKSFTIILIS